MEKKLSIAEQLDLAEKALAELKKKYERGDEHLYMCWIFYDLLGLKPKLNYRIEDVNNYVDLFTLDNMAKHSNTRYDEDVPYESDEYEQRKEFLEWMISEYKSMLAKN